MRKKIFIYILLPVIISAFGNGALGQANITTEDDYYKIIKVPIPKNITLEVGGICTLPSGEIAAATRYGNIWIIENPTSIRPNYRKFASGLHEILGLRFVDGAFYCAQRSELSRLEDRNGDGVADLYETFYAWPVSGHYHEYSFGPVIDPVGNMYVTGNVAFGSQEWWRGESRVPWRGWTMKITPEGEMQPWATGMRSPAGLGMVDGEFFYTENQGDWVGSGAVFHVEKGDFTGHPAGLRWSELPESPVELTTEQLYSKVDPRMPPEGGPYIQPENIEDEEPTPLFSLKEYFPDIKPPAVWLPHGVLGISTSEMIIDKTEGAFGPFAGQVFIGDQGQSKITRVFLEKINGEYQGAAFAFREGFKSGVLRMTWGKDNSLYVGQTNRGWGSTGPEPYALERLVWTGKTPFEMKTVKAMPDGFEIEFTQPVDINSASDPSAYKITGFIYKYHPVYGSPAVNTEDSPVIGIKVSEDGKKVRLVVDNLRRYYIHEIVATVKNKEDQGLLHNTAYYTLNNIPKGEKLATSELTTVAKSTSPKPVEKPVEKKTAPKPESPKVKLAKRTTTMPSGWGEPDVTLQLGTKPGLKYDIESFTVKAGSKLKLVFSNPDDMPHNALIVEPGMADKVGQTVLQLGIQGAAQDYVPEMDEVLYHTKLVQPGGGDAIYFYAPAIPGNYQYVCTYPGHYISMRGVLKVVE